MSDKQLSAALLLAVVIGVLSYLCTGDDDGGAV